MTIFRVNRYLANSNNTIFNPKGLFCLIVKYKPDEQMSKAQNALRNGHSLVKTKALDRLGILEDIPSGDSIPQLPPSAPLIFTSPPSKDKGLKRAVTRRHDRKAQENYVRNPLFLCTLQYDRGRKTKSQKEATDLAKRCSKCSPVESLESLQTLSLQYFTVDVT